MMNYVDVTASETEFHTVRSPLVEPFQWYFDGVAVGAPDAGIDIRLAFGNGNMVAVAQGWTTGHCIVMNNHGASLIIAPVTTGVCGTAAEYVGDNKFRIAAVVGATWKSWILTFDLKAVTLESEQPTLNGSSQGWTDFQNNTPTWADVNRVIHIGNLTLGLPMTRDKYTVGQSYVVDGADAYNSLLNQNERVASSNSPKPPRIAALPNGNAMVAISADNPLFVSSSEFTIPWPPVEPPIDPDVPVDPDIPDIPDIPVPETEDDDMGAIELIAKRLKKNTSGPFQDRYYYESPDGTQMLSIDSNGVASAKPVTDTHDANESIIWDGTSKDARIWPHANPFDVTILCLVNTDPEYNAKS